MARILTDRVDSRYHRVPQKDAVVESAVENAHFQRNARGFSKKRHLCGYKDHRALTVGEKKIRSDGFSGRKPPPS